MLSAPTSSSLFQRDGTSQAQRPPPALDPAYVAVDERSIRDLLAFARQYAGLLRFFDEQLDGSADWSAFLDGDLDEMAAYLAHPEAFADAPEKKARYGRPHLALFLTFLHLLQHARARLNEFTRRHLEFFYREALRLTPKAAVPDQVHVLVELAPGQPAYRLPAGSLLRAGADSLGQDLFYRTDHDLVANQARVGRLQSLFVVKKRIGLRDVRENPDLLREGTAGGDRVWDHAPLRDQAFLAMMELAVGEAANDYHLPPYPGGRTPDAALFADLDALLAFIRDDLYLRLPVFRTVMQTKHRLDAADDDWQTVNDILKRAGAAKDDAFDPAPLDEHPRAFEANLTQALAPNYDGLPDVENIYDLYLRRDRADVQLFIQSQPDPTAEADFDPDAGLHMPLEDFDTMMGVIDEQYQEWRRLYDLLRAAGRRKQRAHPEHRLQAVNLRAYENQDFGTLVARTLGEIPAFPSVGGNAVAGFDEAYAEVRTLEAYVATSAEDFARIREIHADADARAWAWEQVYEILEAAHQHVALAQRRADLHQIHDEQGFDAMIREALGDPRPGDPLPDARAFMELDDNDDAGYIRENLFLDPVTFRFVKNTATSADPAEGAWESVYGILAQAQRKKRGWAEPRAQIEKWENVFVAPDATRVQVQSGAEAPDATPRWRTFGAGYHPGDDAPTAPATVGLALAAPLLALAEGTRTITLTLGFDAAHFNKTLIDETLRASIPFRFFLSTEKAMMAMPETAEDAAAPVPIDVRCGTFEVAGAEPGATESYEHALQITLRLGPQDPPIGPAPPEVSGLLTPWPLLYLHLKDVPDGKTLTKRYRPFQRLRLDRVHLKVQVEGLTQLTLQNDDAVLDPKKPFEPFGSYPVAGTSLYVAHPELCAKRLDDLTITATWMGVPADFRAHYLGYAGYDDPLAAPASPIAGAAAFTAEVKLYDNRARFEIAEIPLFPARAGTRLTRAQIERSYAAYGPELALKTGTEVLDWSRYWQLELTPPAFLHDLYPRASAGGAAKVTEETIQVRVGGTDANPTMQNVTIRTPIPFTVAPPYTPQIKRLALGYTATAARPLAAAGPDLALYHLEPFGYRALAPEPDGTYPFLPQYPDQGVLYVGIEGLVPPQNLSLLFQMAEGSADPDLPREPIHWSYLDGDRWRTLEAGNVLSDTTNGLLNSGIVRFALPPARPGTSMPPAYYWIRATIARNTHAVADAVAVHTQAVRATFDDHGNAPDHLDAPLPPDRITGLADPAPEVVALHQPYSSTGGKAHEQPKHFYTRVSERLRHKNRALTSWDYERLILEAFPDIYKVKCLPVGASDDPRQAAHVQVLVVPDIRGKLPSDPFEPKAPADTLLAVERFLQRRSPPLARFEVKNPRYVQLKVHFAVRFREGYNAGYYLPVLNEELQRYLAPWAYDQSAEIVFGGKVNANLIVNFVEERDYVDYLAGITLFVSPDGEDFVPAPTDADVQTLAGGMPDVILVSAREHALTEITEDAYAEESYIGINNMKVELDFTVA